MRQQKLLHQQQLARSLNGIGHAALVTRRQPGVLARQDAAVTGHKRLQQLRVAVVQLVDGEIHLRARARCARLGLVAVPLILVVLLGHVT